MTDLLYGADSSSRTDVFLSVYARELASAHAAHPEQYGWPIEDLPVILQRMRAAILRRSFNKDSPAFKRTCKELGIPHTYKAIQTFLTAGSRRAGR